MAMLSRLGGVPASAIKVAETTKATGFTLSAADRGRRFTCTAVLTIVVPSAAVLGGNFTCEIFADGTLGEDDRITFTVPGPDTVFLGRGGTFTIVTVGGKVAVRSGGLMVKLT
jgi:hypothetical protein